jgi:hypothetical protein
MVKLMTSDDWWTDDRIPSTCMLILWLHLEQMPRWRTKVRPRITEQFRLLFGCLFIDYAFDLVRSCETQASFKIATHWRLALKPHSPCLHFPLSQENRSMTPTPQWHPPHWHWKHAPSVLCLFTGAGSQVTASHGNSHEQSCGSLSETDSTNDCWDLRSWDTQSRDGAKQTCQTPFPTKWPFSLPVTGWPLVRDSGRAEPGVSQAWDRVETMCCCPPGLAAREEMVGWGEAQKMQSCGIPTCSELSFPLLTWSCMVFQYSGKVASVLSASTTIHPIVCTICTHISWRHSVGAGLLVLLLHLSGWVSVQAAWPQPRMGLGHSPGWVGAQGPFLFLTELYPS